jgi:hypothetical protein
MALVSPGYLHRVALAVDDAGVADEWFTRVLGVGSLGDDAEPGERRSEIRSGEEADLAGTETRMFWLGGYPFILLSKGVPGGPVAKFLSRYGPAVHSLAWEIEDMWTTQNLLIQQEIRIGAVNIPGRHFFMHPRDTHGVLMEWTDDSFGPNGRRTEGGEVEVQTLAWVTAAVVDAGATAEFLTELAGATPVGDNAQGPADRETTIDLQVGDVTVRLVTPLSSDSPYAAVLEGGPRLCSYALRVADLDGTLKALDGIGIPTVRRDGDLAATDPASTLGVPMEWTS